MTDYFRLSGQHKKGHEIIEAIVLGDHMNRVTFNVMMLHLLCKTAKSILFPMMHYVIILYFISSEV
ncbi:hypothetical protein MEG1DRAFT_03116 [Photorhabdus temperata subsp. temperata Meg1]|uniref:Uncharacterized protein n=1 Tax=Photorhabdus temperata subsp. temperata Meg1 TaxID=1393735 RepID=A0A081RUE5_PHOTE|nr:hypothetical protein MEG1DRAFT_03116 [Photorhabdus temperata subsp. temperata Meg1]